MAVSSVSLGLPLPHARWIEPPAPPDSPRFHADPLLHALLSRRLPSPEAVAPFLDPRDRPLPDPFAVPGMTEAVARLRRAIEREETVAVFGDYDADGITATAIATLALRAASRGALPAFVELPTRGDGYGLNPATVRRFAADGATLLLALDCGSSDHEAVALARSLGLDAVVVDHHELHGPPPADAIVVSSRLRPDAPCRDLPAAGLALLLAAGLARSGLDVGEGRGRDPDGLTDLAAIGIVADVCDLRAEGRTLVRAGLRRLRNGVGVRPGLAALLRALALDPAAVDSRALGWRIGPALNAPGRAGDPQPALDLLLASGAAVADRQAARVVAAWEWARGERQRHVATLAAAFAERPDKDRRRVAVVRAEACPPGVAGAVASALTGELGRPVVVLGRAGDSWRGSARSHGGFDIGGALQQLSHLLVRSGGHRLAAGLEVRDADLPALEDALDAAAAAAGVEPSPEPSLELEAVLPAERIAPQTVRLLDTLRPFGPGNPEPLLKVERICVLEASRFGRAGDHLRLRFWTPRGAATAIAWNAADRHGEARPGRVLDLAGRLERNAWNGEAAIRFVAEDFRPAATGS